MEHIALELLHFLQQGNLLLEQMISDAALHWQISPAEARILLFLFSKPKLNTAKEIARHCGMSKASVSGSVLKLTTKGLLQVDVDRSDRRFQHLTLTEHATPILKMIQEKVLSVSHKLLSPLSQEDKNHLVSLLLQINDGTSVR